MCVCAHVHTHIAKLLAWNIYSLCFRIRNLNHESKQKSKEDINPMPGLQEHLYEMCELHAIKKRENVQ